jgi:ribosomal protein S12 methylthiotransferase
MLERMRRETSRQHIVDLISKIRAGIPGIALRTTFIVGFPGETEAYFESLLEFIQTTLFERLGVFAYSRQDGTRAGKMEGQIPDAVKKKRQQRAMSEQLKIARQLSAARVGQTAAVLVEREAGAGELQNAAALSSWEHGLIRSSRRSGGIADFPAGKIWIARGEADAPDIDGRVYLRGAASPGEFSRVRIIGHTDYDLIAEPA